MGNREVKASTCRVCTAYCPVEVTIDEGRVVRVKGDYAAPLYGGFTCPKGRALPSLHGAPDRLRTSMKRMPDGSYTPIATDEAIGEIAEKLRGIVDRFGPRAVAGLLGNPVIEQPATAPLMMALLRAIGSPMFFTNATLDQPNVMVADALHGMWDGGRMRPDDLDAFLLFGGNPIVSKQYFGQNPGMRLKELKRNGLKLIVVDPRRTETARRATIHLQSIPGEDPTIAAGLVHLLLEMDAVDADFVARNARGLETLADAVAPFTAAYVASRAGVPEDDLRSAATVLSQARRGGAGTGTGTSMSTRGTVTCYLLDCLLTLRGFWPREGDEVMFSPVLMPPSTPRAQPRAPMPATGFGHKLRVRGLEESVAGLPSAALPEEILTPGDGQVRALFMHSGPMRTMPDEGLTHRALRSLDLCVVHDVEMSPTARVSDYVIASTLAFEIPVLSLLGEISSVLHPGYGWTEPFGSCQPALVDPPEGADVIDAWRLYFRLGRRLGLQLHVGSMLSPDPQAIEMGHEPTTEEIYAMMCEGSAVPLERVKEHPHGHVYEEARTSIGPRDPACDARFELADGDMLATLATIAGEDVAARRGTDDRYPLLFIPRRTRNRTNGGHRIDAARLKTRTNPAFVHPRDLRAYGLTPGDLVDVRSRHGEVTVAVEEDATLRPGVVAIAHGFGRGPDEPGDPLLHGANINRLTRLDEDFDPYSGLPRMGAIPVALVPHTATTPTRAA